MNLFDLRRFNSQRFSAAGASLAVAALCGIVCAAGAQSEVHGRGWKPLPPTAHIVVTVLKGFNGKPLSNAAVVFHAVRDGKNDGNLEVKTDEEGKAAIDVIEIGSHLTVQVIANGFATSATDMEVDGPQKTLEVKLLRPRAQVSVYQDTDGKPATEKPGIQEPAHGISPSPAAPKTAPATPPVDPTKPTAVPAPSTPPLLSSLVLPGSPFQQTQTPAPAAPAATERPAATPLTDAPADGPHRAIAPPVLVTGTASPLTVIAPPAAKPDAGPATVAEPVTTQRAGPRPAATAATAAPIADYGRATAQPAAGAPVAAPLADYQRATAQPAGGTQTAAPLADYQRATAQPVGGTPTVTALPVAPPTTSGPASSTPTVVPLTQNAPVRAAPLPTVVPLPRSTLPPADPPAPETPPSSPLSIQQ